jgi:WD40 repeat protein
MFCQPASLRIWSQPESDFGRFTGMGWYFYTPCCKPLKEGMTMKKSFWLLCLLLFAVFAPTAAQDNVVSKPARVLLHDDNVWGAAWSADGSRILSWSKDGTARIWDAATGEEVLRLEHGAEIVKAYWNKDETQVVTTGMDGIARIWDARTGDTTLQLLTGSGGGVLDAAWNANETRIATVSAPGSGSARSGNIQIWDAKTGKSVLSLAKKSYVYAVTWNQKGDRLLSFSNEGTIVVWNAKTGAAILTVKHKDMAMGALWSADERRILSWSLDGTAIVWDALKGKPLATYAHKNSVSGGLWSADEKQTLTWDNGSSADDPLSGPSNVHVWDSATHEELFTLPHKDWITDAAWSPSGSRILSTAWDGTTNIWDAKTGDLLTVFKDGRMVNGAAWRPDEIQILSWSNPSFDMDCTTERCTGQVSIWDVK